MVQRHRYIVGAVHPSTVIATTSAALHLPVMGMMLAAFGLILLVAGTVDMPSRATSNRRAWLQAPIVDGSSSVNIEHDERPPASAPSDSLNAKRAARQRPESANSATVVLHVQSSTSDDRIADALFVPAPMQPAANPPHRSGDSFTGDEQLPNPNNLAAEWDVRWGLMEMAGAQRGHWIRQCPCYPENRGPR
ncbi:MAG: hypothetical protein ACRDJC_10650 [Thermomicrobiales bacterium]